MVNETGNRNRILEMCKFRIRFRLAHCGTITSVIRKHGSSIYRMAALCLSETRLDSRLKVCLHDAAGCSTGLTIGCIA